MGVVSSRSRARSTMNRTASPQANGAMAGGKKRRTIRNVATAISAAARGPALRGASGWSGTVRTAVISTAIAHGCSKTNWACRRWSSSSALARVRSRSQRRLSARATNSASWKPSVCGRPSKSCTFSSNCFKKCRGPTVCHSLRSDSRTCGLHSGGWSARKIPSSRASTAPCN